MSRSVNVCFNLIPIYFGERGISTRGEFQNSKDYLYRCYHTSLENNIGIAREFKSISELCAGCTRYYYKLNTKSENQELRLLLEIGGSKGAYKHRKNHNSHKK